MDTVYDDIEAEARATWRIERPDLDGLSGPDADEDFDLPPLTPEQQAMYNFPKDPPF